MSKVSVMMTCMYILIFESVKDAVSVDMSYCLFCIVFFLF